MKRIRIKIKHLIYIVLGTFISVFFILPSALFMYAQAVENKNVEVSKVIYKKYIDLFPYGNARAEALYKLARSIVPEDGFNSRYKIYTTGFSSGGSVITKEMTDNAISYYKEIMSQYKDSKYYNLSYSSLIEAYNMEGRYDESEKLIENGLKSEKDDIRLCAAKYRMLSYMIGKAYDEGRALGDMLIKDDSADPDIYMLMGDINFYDRKLDDAMEYYKKAKEMTVWKQSGNTGKFLMNYNDNAMPDDKIKIIDRIKSGYKGDSAIHGSVIINGRPAPFVFVYLKDERDGDLNSTGDERWRLNAITDFKGEYVLPSLPEGNYILGIGVPTAYLSNTLFQTPREGYFHLNKGENRAYDFTFVPPMKIVKPSGTVVPVDNKVEIKWDKVEGAAYYLVRLIEFEDPKKIDGSYGSFAASDKIIDTRYTVDINRMNMGVHGFMMDDNGMLNPHAYLGPFYPGSKVPFFVEAYDKSGGLISSSVAMKLDFKDMTVIRIPDEGIIEGDRLVLDKKPEEAVISYEKALKENPYDIHSMMVLSKIYSVGTRRKYDALKADEIEGRNRERAVELTKRLYELTKDLYYLKAPLEMYFIDELGNYKWALEEYGKIPEKYLNVEDYARIAQYNLTLKNFKEADRYYEKVYEAYKDTNYYDIAPVILKLYYKDYDSALKILSILDLRLYKIDRDKVESDIKGLSNLNKVASDYKKFEGALEIILTFRSDKNYKNKYKSVYENINDPLLLELLKSIGNYYYVFENY